MTESHELPASGASHRSKTVLFVDHPSYPRAAIVRALSQQRVAGPTVANLDGASRLCRDTTQHFDGLVVPAALDNSGAFIELCAALRPEIAIVLVEDETYGARDIAQRLRQKSRPCFVIAKDAPAEAVSKAILDFVVSSGEHARDPRDAQGTAGSLPRQGFEARPARQDDRNSRQPATDANRSRRRRPAVRDAYLEVAAAQVLRELLSGTELPEAA